LEKKKKNRDKEQILNSGHSLHDFWEL